MQRPTAMDETRFAEEFLCKMQAGEFDGRLYETIAKLSTHELQQIAARAGEQSWPAISSDARRMQAHDVNCKVTESHGSNYTRTE